MVMMKFHSHDHAGVFNELYLQYAEDENKNEVESGNNNEEEQIRD